MSFEVFVLLIALALAFDFMNGFHDAANSIATVVSTGVLKPHHAVAFAAFFNFVALFVFQLKVAATVGKGIVDPSIVDHYVIFGALVGALFWNIITWYYGIPSSSSHALIGGLIGAVVAKVGTGGLVTVAPVDTTRASRYQMGSSGGVLGIVAATAVDGLSDNSKNEWRYPLVQIDLERLPNKAYASR